MRASRDPFTEWTFDDFYKEDGLVMDSAKVTPMLYTYVTHRGKVTPMLYTHVTHRGKVTPMLYTHVTLSRVRYSERLVCECI